MCYLKIRHNNVVQCYGVVCPPLEEGEQDQERFIVMEYLPYNLRQWIRATGGLSNNLELNKLYTVAKGIAQGINYLHKCSPPIIHRDLKVFLFFFLC
jgi:serine/threonine protein kinase